MDESQYRQKKAELINALISLCNEARRSLKHWREINE